MDLEGRNAKIIEYPIKNIKQANKRIKEIQNDPNFYGYSHEASSFYLQKIYYFK